MELTKRLIEPQTSVIKILSQIAHAKIVGEKRDYFIHHKYEMIKEYYGKSCLDIGAGNGSFSNYLENNNHQVSSIDVVDKTNDEINRQVQLFDGKNIPFRDDSFDTSIMMFVLHHTDMQEELMRDAIRVSRKYILIAEDIIENKFDSLIGAIHLNTSPWDKGNDSFKTHQQWISFFKAHDLEVIKTVPISRWVYPVYPVSRMIYVLKSHK